MDILMTIMLLFILIILFFFLFWRLWFLRNPKRKIPVGDYIVSPADGRINKIITSDAKKTTIKKGTIGKINTLASEVSEKYILINIVMTPLDVHFQRSPIQGEIKNIKYKKGKFKNAVKKEIAIENENNQILIEGKQKVKVIQIAGFLARRINCFVKKNQKVKKGEVIGLINLGSQVSVILPYNSKIKVKKGQRVKAGESKLAKVLK
ncbi:MAG: phosphatidylserine decarboxylase [Nanobdellota archaeon]